MEVHAFYEGQKVNFNSKVEVLWPSWKKLILLELHPIHWLTQVYGLP